MGIKLLKLICVLVFIFQVTNFTLASNVVAELVVDQTNGKILYNNNADIAKHPASITKVMTLYLTFEALKSKKISLLEQLRVSKHASNQERSNLNLQSGSLITVRDAIMACIIHSANDAAVVLAERIGGTEENFARLMTQRAKMLGMNKTNFMNASGLTHTDHKTTAVDIAKLAIAIQRDHPEHYHLFAKKHFTFNGRVYNSHNHVTKNYAGATGLKTGFTSKAGFTLVTTVNKNNKRLIGVVLGSPTRIGRDNRMIALLNKHFDSKPMQVVTSKPNKKKIIIANLNNKQLKSTLKLDKTKVKPRKKIIKVAQTDKK